MQPVMQVTSMLVLKPHEHPPEGWVEQTLLRLIADKIYEKQNEFFLEYVSRKTNTKTYFEEEGTEHRLTITIADKYYIKNLESENQRLKKALIEIANTATNQLEVSEEF